MSLKGIRNRPINSITRSLGRLSKRWLNRKYPFRKKALERLSARSGFSKGMTEALLDATFREMTEKKLSAMMESELGDASVLDGFRKDRSGRSVRAQGPESIVHVFASNIPNAAVWSFVFGMLVKSRNIGALSRRDEGILDLYLASLKTVDRGLYSQNRLLDPGDRKALGSYIKEAGLVVAYGNDGSLGAIRRQIPAATPFIGYGHRVSIGLYLKEALSDPKLPAKAAYDVWMADQRGCLSPVIFYIEQEGAVFARKLADGLKRLQKKDRSVPRRQIASAVSAQSVVQGSMVARLKGKHSFVLESTPRGRWTVSYEDGLRPSLGSSYQIAGVRSFDDIEKVFFSLRPVRKYLQCVALECGRQERPRLAEKLSLLGVNRVCRAGKMQTPPISWHHDGKPNLASWVTWTDLEE